VISVVITTYNEGDDLIKTVESINENTSRHEIVIVDDGGTDDSVSRAVTMPNVVMKRNDERIGIAYSRNVGVDASKGDTVAFLDGHQRVTKDCLNDAAKLAKQTGGIVWPCMRGLKDRGWTSFGSWMRFQDHHRKKGLFGGRYDRRQPRERVSRIGTMMVPGYVMQKSTFNEKVRLIDGLRGWGASEPALSVKAFFTDTPIFGLRADFYPDGRWKRGPMTRHMFREGGHMPFSQQFRGVCANHMAIARVCFSDYTFRRYFRRINIYRKKLGDEGIQQVYDYYTEQHKAFQKIKKRPDSEFWRGLMLEDVPRGVKD
jgi:glycosyltransferase involved in cell wall biosynthesis